MKYTTLVLLVALMSPSAALAANGEDCNTDITQFTKPAGGVITPITCVTLVDDISSASGGPIIYNLGASTSSTRGLPDVISFLVGTDNDCTAGSVVITSSEVSGGAENNVGGTLANSTLDVDTSSPAGFTRINVNLRTTPIGPFINTRWSGVAGCTGGFDILMIPYEIKR